MGKHRKSSDDCDSEGNIYDKILGRLKDLEKDMDKTEKRKKKRNRSCDCIKPHDNCMNHTFPINVQIIINTPGVRVRVSNGFDRPTVCTSNCVYRSDVPPRLLIIEYISNQTFTVQFAGANTVFNGAILGGALSVTTVQTNIPNPRDPQRPFYGVATIPSGTTSIAVAIGG
jgi:hypothetical protein